MSIDIELRKKFSTVKVFPQSMAGLCWLQLHFNNGDWDNLVKQKVFLTEEHAINLAKDAEAANITVNLSL